MAIVAPEEAAAMFARNPELARAHPDVVEKVNAALSAHKAAHDAAHKVAPAEVRRAVQQPPRRSTTNGVSAAQGAIRAYRSIPNSGSGMGKVVVRLAVAVAAFLVALEVASYVSGRYFSWNLGKGAQNVHGAAKSAAGYVGLYPGQKAPGAA